MRTFSSFSLALLAATAIVPAAGAQRHPRLTSRARSAPPGISTRPASSASSGCDADCDDFSLSVVSAVLPAEASGSGPEYVTLVIENRGTVVSPASVVMVAPKDHLTLARQSGIGSLAPGERVTVRLPVEIGPDGTPCVAITIRSAPIPAVLSPRFLAAAPVSAPYAEPTAVPALPDGTQWAGAEDWGFVSPFDALGNTFGAA